MESHLHREDSGMIDHAITAWGSQVNVMELHARLMGESPSGAALV